jgi:His-Xaa-Ser system protein HxsD
LATAVATEVVLTVDESIYDIDTVNRTAFAFTGRCHVSLQRADDGRVRVSLKPLGSTALPTELAAQFENALIDQRIRGVLARETATIRDLIYRQAFVEADL